MKIKIFGTWVGFLMSTALVSGDFVVLAVSDVSQPQHQSKMTNTGRIMENEEEEENTYQPDGEKASRLCKFVLGRKEDISRTELAFESSPLPYPMHELLGATFRVQNARKNNNFIWLEPKNCQVFRQEAPTAIELRDVDLEDIIIGSSELG